MSTSTDQQQPSQMVTFKLGNEDYGIDVMRVREIILPETPTRVPEMPEFIEGVINLRGDVVPVIDLRKRLKLAVPPQTPATRIIIASVGSKGLGMIVDQVSEVLRLSNAIIEPPPPSIAGLGKEYLKGLVKVGKRLIIFLDIDRILSVSEKGALPT